MPEDLTPDDFNGPYDPNASGQPDQSTFTPDTEHLWPSITGWLGQRMPSISDAGSGLLSRGEYILGRGERGLTEAMNPGVQLPDMPRPDLPTGLIGSEVESFARNPIPFFWDPGAATWGAATNELAQGFPTRERQLAGGLLAVRGVKPMLAGIHLGAHYGGMIGHAIGLPTTGKVAGAIAGIPIGLYNIARDPWNVGRAITGGYVAGEDRPSSQPGRTTQKKNGNQLQNQD